MTSESADLKGRKVLFIAYFYPPTSSTGVPGSMRMVKFIRSLSNGKCHVLTAPSLVPDADNALQHISLPVNNENVYRVAAWDLFRWLLALRRTLHRFSGSKQRKEVDTPSGSPPVFKSDDAQTEYKSRFQRLKDFIYDLCYFPDQAGPWILPAFFKGRSIVRNQDIDVIFATGSPWSGLTAGYLISRITGKPLITDFRDPWVNNPFHQSKGHLLDRWSATLEEKVVRHAASVSLNTEALRDEFLERYPELPPEHFFVMPNGIDRQDFQHISSRHDDAGDKTKLTLCHAGFLYGVRDPGPLLDALREFELNRKADDPVIMFKQIGDVSLNYDIRERYRDLIDQGRLVLQPAMPYQACLEELAQADIVVNIQSGTKTQVPSKLYDYLAIDRPILHLTPKSGALGKLVDKYQLGTSIDLEHPETLNAYLCEQAEKIARGEPIEETYHQRDRFFIEKISKDLADKIIQLTKGRTQR